MYTVYVRPILESGCEVWSPLLKSNIDRVEKVQRYFTKRLNGLFYMSYIDRLNYLKIDSLESRRKKSDLCLFYNTVNGIVPLDISDHYKIVKSARKHNKYLYTFYSRTDVRKHFWINRLVKDWNKLGYDIVNSSSSNIFKNKLNILSFKGRGSIDI